MPCGSLLCNKNDEDDDDDDEDNDSHVGSVLT